ncbi:MAG TPA: hypothetical protein VFH42_07675 [Sporolactobacillaceae bacterium]|nr:hypothetical protein [Sporolactobacillaceae bacterium]
MQQQHPSQQMMNQNQQVMSEPPATLTVKDHLYLEDMLSWNLNAVKKAHFFAGQCQDPEIKQAIVKMAMTHQQHYQKLLGHLQNEMSRQMQPQSQPQMGGMQ